ncbi:6805_t:CDS:2, partial [Ambispora leptoticha]
DECNLVKLEKEATWLENNRQARSKYLFGNHPTSQLREFNPVISALYGIEISSITPKLSSISEIDQIVNIDLTKQEIFNKLREEKKGHLSPKNQN